MYTPQDINPLLMALFQQQKQIRNYEAFLRATQGLPADAVNRDAMSDRLQYGQDRRDDIMGALG